MKVFLIFIYCFAFTKANVVHLNDGPVEGLQETSRGGVPYYAFRGMKYAEPPIGKLRFMDPEKPARWTDTIKAFEYGSVCPQIQFVTKEVVGDENCLFVNVFTPSLDPEANIPVLFWIHPGAFQLGSSSTYEPKFIMDKNVVLVTFNYRLGGLGFLHLDEIHMPGNYGMKDQVQALLWVEENIIKFGGNPDKVTLVGESSGGASTNWHMYSPLSAGLFHQVISQSGTARSIWAEIPSDVAERRTRAIATAAGCVYKSPKAVLEFLQKLPLSELILRTKMFEVPTYLENLFSSEPRS